MELEDETRLVARLLSGDDRALDQFVVTYRRFITSILSRQPLVYSDDVEELYQRFLFHIWEDDYKRLRPWRGTRSLRGYLGAVARNLARDYGRERRFDLFDLNDALECSQWVTPLSEDADTQSNRRHILQSSMEQLSDRDRDLIHRRYYQEESYREIAQALGMTVNHVGVALNRAEFRLRSILQNLGQNLGRSL